MSRLRGQIFKIAHYPKMVDLFVCKHADARSVDYFPYCHRFTNFIFRIFPFSKNATCLINFLAGERKKPKPEPDIQFGRYSDNNKPVAKS